MDNLNIIKQKLLPWMRRLASVILLVAPFVPETANAEKYCYTVVADSAEKGSASVVVCGSNALSEVFTRELKWSDIPFRVLLKGRVGNDGTPGFELITLKSLKNRQSQGYNEYSKMRFHLLHKTIANEVSSWANSHITKIQTAEMEDIGNKDSIFVWLFNSPLYFARDSDLLFCMRFTSGRQFDYVHERPFGITDRKSMYVGAVSRDGGQIVITYRDTSQLHPCYVERYILHRIDSAATREGFSEYLSPNGKVLFRHFFRNDTLVFSEKLNKNGTVTHSYHFKASAATILNTDLQQERAYYPDGKLRWDCLFGADTMVIHYYDHKGKQAAYQPSSDAAQTVLQYVSENMKLPVTGDTALIVERKSSKTFKVGNATYTSKRYNSSMEEGEYRVSPSGIRSLHMQDTLVFYVTDKGDMKCISRRNRKNATWTYEWDDDVISEDYVKLLIDDVYRPFLTEFVMKLQQNAVLHCTPATVNGIPEESFVIVRISKTFHPE